MQMGGTFDLHSNSGGTSPPGNNRYRLSFLVPVTPFIEQQALWEQISNPLTDKASGETFAAMGPTPWTRGYEPWESEIPTLRCPVTDSIEAGDATVGTVIVGGSGSRVPGSPSPYGLWGALGTRANAEKIEEDL